MKDLTAAREPPSREARSRRDHIISLSRQPRTMLLEVSGELISGCLLANLLKRYLPSQHRHRMPMPLRISLSERTAVLCFKRTLKVKVANLDFILPHRSLSLSAAEKQTSVGGYRSVSFKVTVDGTL